MVRDNFLEKHTLTHFLSQNSAFSRHFGILGGPKRATTSSKHAKNTCFGIPCGAGSFLKIVIFFLHRVDLVDPFWHHLFGLPLAACRGPLGLGTRLCVLVWGRQQPMCTNSGAFGGLLGAVRGRMVELEGPRGPLDKGKSSCMCRVATVCLHLAGFSCF